MISCTCMFSDRQSTGISLELTNLTRLVASELQVQLETLSQKPRAIEKDTSGLHIHLHTYTQHTKMFPLF